MGKKSKIQAVNTDVIDNILEDIDGNRVDIFAIEDVPEYFIENKLVHPDVLEKSTSFCMAVSGCVDDGRDFCYFAALRHDEENGNTVTDMDPLVIAYNHDSQTTEPSGVITFHGKYEGRTEIEDHSINISLKQLRSTVQTKKLTFKDALPRFTSTMHHVAEEYRKHIDKKNS